MAFAQVVDQQGSSVKVDQKETLLELKELCHGCLVNFVL